MSTRRFPLVSVASLALALALALQASSSQAAGDPVRVTNFPRVQRVEVERFPEVQIVSLKGHPPVTAFRAWKDQRVAPVSPATGPVDLERFHSLGRLDATGFASLRLSVAGRLSGSRTDTHRLDLILLPDTKFIRDAWKNDGVVLLETRVRFDLKLAERGLFQATADPITLRFPRYLAFLRNHSAQALELDLYLQLGE